MVGTTATLVPETAVASDEAAEETTLEARLERAVESVMTLLSAVTVSAVVTAVEAAVEAAPPVGVKPRVLKAVEPPACAAATVKKRKRRDGVVPVSANAQSKRPRPNS